MYRNVVCVCVCTSSTGICLAAGSQTNSQTVMSASAMEAVCLRERIRRFLFCRVLADGFHLASFDLPRHASLQFDVTARHDESIKFTIPDGTSKKRESVMKILFPPHVQCSLQNLQIRWKLDDIRYYLMIWILIYIIYTQFLIPNLFGCFHKLSISGLPMAGSANMTSVVTSCGSQKGFGFRTWTRRTETHPRWPLSWGLFKS